jgi:FkbM family methyltransferase
VRIPYNQTPVSIRHNLAGYYSNLGLPGVLAISAYHLFGRPKEITALPPSIRNPVHIRMRTSDASIYGGILLRGQYAFDLPFSPKTIVDAGANIGMASIYFTHRYPQAETSNFVVLARNVQPYPAIIPLHAALWNRDGEISVRQRDSATGVSAKCAFVTHEGIGAKVRAITMRTLMKEMQIHAVDVLKVNIEGAEKEVFEVCDWMDHIRCLMIELHDRFTPGCSEAVESAARGFSKLQRAKRPSMSERHDCGDAKLP